MSITLEQLFLFFFQWRGSNFDINPREYTTDSGPNFFQMTCMADVNSFELYSFSSQGPSRRDPYRSAAGQAISISEIKFGVSAGFQWFSAFREQTRKTQKLIN